MDLWAGIALALRTPDDDALRSRVPTYLHPLAGRSLAWHVLGAMLSLEPPPAQLLLVASMPLDRAVVGELPVQVLTAPVELWWEAVAARLDSGVDRLLVVDAAAAALSQSLAALRAEAPGRALVGPDGEVLAVWLTREQAARRAGGARSVAQLAQGLEPLQADPAEAFIVRDRARLARAGARIRDRLVRRLMDAGATFLLPETVLVDVDVKIGPDSVVYPGVVLEGSTSIGAETVVGPGCRIIDSWIGSGVELKGWNYIVGASIHNRAVLEPNVRRGFD